MSGVPTWRPRTVRCCRIRPASGAVGWGTGGFVKLSMGARLRACFACVLALTLALGAFSVVQMRQQQAVAAEIAGHWLPGIALLGELRDLTSRIRRREFQHLIAQSAQERRKYEKEIADLKEKVAAERRAYERLALSPPEREALNVFASSLDAYYTAGGALMALSSQGEKSFEAARNSINAPEGVSRKSFNAVLDQLDAMIVKGRDSGRAAEQASAAAARAGGRLDAGSGRGGAGDRYCAGGVDHAFKREPDRARDARDAVDYPGRSRDRDHRRFARPDRGAAEHTRADAPAHRWGGGVGTRGLARGVAGGR